jgi:hypothetical protein
MIYPLVNEQFDPENIRNFEWKPVFPPRTARVELFIDRRLPIKKEDFP